MVLGEGGAKMSKSLGNVISPDDLINNYGADVTRAYMMFMGPYEGDVVWSSETINGVKRFVSKYYSFILDAWDRAADESGEKEHKAAAKLIKRVSDNILSLKFNTSISALMEFYNEFCKGTFCKEDIEKLIIVISPSLPHMAEELWNLIGHADSVFESVWPNIDKKLLEEDTVEVPVQINGRVRGRITISTSDTENLIKEKVLLDKAFSAYLTDQEIKKFIYVPNKIINVVV
jgi:leucyl-tRNA synthetase